MGGSVPFGPLGPYRAKIGAQCSFAGCARKAVGDFWNPERRTFEVLCDDHVGDGESTACVLWEQQSNNVYKVFDYRAPRVAPTRWFVWLAGDQERWGRVGAAGIEVTIVMNFQPGTQICTGSTTYFGDTVLNPENDEPG